LILQIYEPMATKKLHFYSGVIITLFVGIHLFNHVYSIFGIEEHIHLMNKLRLIYRNIIIESILILAVVFQIISGFNLVRQKRKLKLPFYGKLQIWSGLYLAVFLLIHVSAVLGGRYVLGLDTNFYFGTAGLNTFPFSLFFIPYYGLAILAFWGHVAVIHSYKMKNSILGFSPFQQSNYILAFGAILTIIIFYGLTNQFTGIEIPNEYDILIGK